MIISNVNKNNIYFRMIRKIDAKSVLDVGMFLKRIGSISRQLMGAAVPEDVKLTGIDYYTDINFPVWDLLYDKKMSINDFLENSRTETYDLAILLDGCELKNQEGWRDLLGIVKKNARYVLFNDLLDDWKRMCPQKKIIKLEIEKDVFYLLDFGDERNGYKAICNDT